jgi:hypothetical protein
MALRKSVNRLIPMENIAVYEKDDSETSKGLDPPTMGKLAI